MVFLSRLRQSQLHNFLRNQMQKRHLQTYALHQPSLHSRIHTLNTPRFSALLQNNPLFHFPNNVRFFAAPVQVKKKEEENETKGTRINEQITAPVIRLVTDEGHTVVSRREALDSAKRLELDLVEVNRNAKPPVCRLMDYSKEKYKQQVKVKERAKTTKANLKKGTVKEIRFAGQITPNDIKLKSDTTRRLLEEGYRVKCVVKRKKKEDDLGNCLSRLLSLIEDISVVEFGPIVEGDQAHFVLRHVKLGPGKRSGKKTSKIDSSSSAHSTQLNEASGESESGRESDEEEDTEKISHDYVFGAEDGATRNARSNKEEVTVPANRYSQPTRSNKEEFSTPANRYSQPARSNKEELATPLNRYSQPARSKKEEWATPPNRYSQPARSNKEELATPPNRYSQPARSNKEELATPPNRYSQPARSNKEELATPPNRYSQPARSNKEELATSPANRYSQPTSSRPSNDSAGRPTAPLSTENRYRRDPRNYNTPVSNNGSRIEPPPAERGRQTQFNSTSPANREGQQSGFGNPNSPANFPRQSSPGSSYGNFNAPASTHEQQNPPGQPNRYKEVSAGASHGTLDNRISTPPDSKYS